MVGIISAKHIFDQYKNENKFPKEDVFDQNVVDLSDIEDSSISYCELIFLSSMTDSFSESEKLTAITYAAHCDGTGPQSYRTTFKVLIYYCNQNLVPIIFGHFVGTECY